jgi:hypothetical protein
VNSTVLESDAMLQSHDRDIWRFVTKAIEYCGLRRYRGDCYIHDDERVPDESNESSRLVRSGDGSARR